MRIPSKWSACVAALTLCALSLALQTPEAAAGDYYLRARAGAYSPQADDVDDLDPGFGAEITVGRYVLPMLSLELSGGYYEASKGAVDLTVKPVTLAVRLRAPLPIFKPYAVAGGGAYFSKLEIAGSGSESDTTFGYFAGAGADVKLLFLLLNIEVKYLWAEHTFFRKTDIDGYVVTAGIGVEF
ncbi:MAG: porin family protein [Deltaproteobacteria bacterium]|nr:porin family protein [Deltaproteobacteria bacterium]